METTASVDALVSLTELVLSLTTRHDCESPTELAGTWSGTYSCEAFGSGDCAGEGGAISLTVFQANHTAAYLDDGGAIYLGAVCGTSFDYSGGGFGYTEEGTMSLVEPGVATKTSHYVSTFDDCEGDCTDALTLD